MGQARGQFDPELLERINSAIAAEAAAMAKQAKIDGVRSRSARAHQSGDALPTRSESQNWHVVANLGRPEQRDDPLSQCLGPLRHLPSR